MDSDQESSSGDSSSATTLEKFFKSPDKYLPSRADCTQGFNGWKDEESLKADSRMLFVGVQNNQRVRMTDETGGDFEESLPFQRCKFMLLQHDKPWLDNVVFDSIIDIHKLDDEKRPKYVRTRQGMLFNAEDGLSTDEILQVTTELEVNAEGDECAVWHRLLSNESDVPIEERKRTKVLIPLVDKASGFSFDTILDPRKYNLQEIVDMTESGHLSFPVRVKPVDVQAEGTRMGTSSNYTIVGLSDAQWLVGILLDDGTFFRIPLSMASRIQVQVKPLKSSDLKLCMHAVLESLADTDLRVVGPQAEGSISARCVTPSTPILPKRTPPEGMQSGYGETLDVPSPLATGSKSSTLQSTKGPFKDDLPEVPLIQRRQSLPHKFRLSDLGQRTRSSGSIRRFSTPAVKVNESTAVPASVAEDAPEKSKPPSGALGWDVANVIKQLDDISLQQYGAQFQREGVTGELFVQLDDEMLRDDFGMANRFHRLKLMNFIKQTKKSDKQPID